LTVFLPPLIRKRGSGGVTKNNPLSRRCEPSAKSRTGIFCCGRRNPDTNKTRRVVARSPPKADDDTIQTQNISMFSRPPLAPPYLPRRRGSREKLCAFFPFVCLRGSGEKLRLGRTCSSLHSPQKRQFSASPLKQRLHGLLGRGRAAACATGLQILGQAGEKLLFVQHLYPQFAGLIELAAALSPQST